MIITSRKWSRFRSPFYSRVRDLMQNDAVVDHDTYLSLANVFLCVSTGGTHSISILSQTPLLSRSCPLFSIPGWSLLSESTFMMRMSWRWWIQLCHISVTFSGFIWYCILLCWCDRSLVYFSWENMSSVKKMISLFTPHNFEYGFCLKDINSSFALVSCFSLRCHGSLINITLESMAWWSSCSLRHCR